MLQEGRHRPLRRLRMYAAVYLEHNRATTAGCMKKDRRKQERLSGVNNVNQKLPPFSIRCATGQRGKNSLKDHLGPTRVYTVPATAMQEELRSQLYV